MENWIIWLIFAGIFCALLVLHVAAGSKKPFRRALGSALNGLSVPASALLLVSRTYPLMVVRSGCLGNAAFFGWHQGMPRIWNAAAIGFAVRCLIRRTPPRWPPCFVALWSRDTVRYLKLRSTGC